MFWGTEKPKLNVEKLNRESEIAELSLLRQHMKKAICRRLTAETAEDIALINSSELPELIRILISLYPHAHEDIPPRRD